MAGKRLLRVAPWVAVILLGACPAVAAVKPQLNCEGVDTDFKSTTLGPIQLMCLSLRLDPTNQPTPASEALARRLVGRKVSAIIDVDPYDRTGVYTWAHDSEKGVLEIAVRGELLTPNPNAPQQPSDAVWWKQAKGGYGILVRTDFPPTNLPYRAVYLSEVGEKADPARLGDNPFYVRLRVTPAEAAALHDTYLEADGVIAAPKSAAVLHCGDLAESWRHEDLGPVQQCVYAVHFTHFAFRLGSTGRVVAHWTRP